jgi:hypothetical protein
VILLIVGAAVAGLLFTGAAPAFLVTLPVPVWGWAIVAVVGVALIALNRRPGD